jgi:hypothetical protein
MDPALAWQLPGDGALNGAKHNPSHSDRTLKNRAPIVSRDGAHAITRIRAVAAHNRQHNRKTTTERNTMALAPVSITPSVAALPVLLKPGPRIMRLEGRTSDPSPRAPSVRIPLNPGETSLGWVPKLVPLHTFPWGAPYDTRTARCGRDFAIVRDGYESPHRFGLSTSMYRPIVHTETVEDLKAASVEWSTRIAYERALIDGHGFHVVHAFKLMTEVSEMVGDLPMVSCLTIVHDYTGKGALRASVVCYLGDDIVIGSRNFTRRIHVGAGDRDVGVGSRARWMSVAISPMLETATLQQGVLAAILRKAKTIAMTEDIAKVFAAHKVDVEWSKPTEAEKAKGEVPRIVPATALDVAIAHHKPKKGLISWGTWSKRLEGRPLAALEKITEISLPTQLFPRR